MKKDVRYALSNLYKIGVAGAILEADGTGVVVDLRPAHRKYGRGMPSYAYYLEVVGMVNLVISSASTAGGAHARPAALDMVGLSMSPIAVRYFKKAAWRGR